MELDHAPIQRKKRKKRKKHYFAPVVFLLFVFIFHFKNLGAHMPPADSEATLPEASEARPGKKERSLSSRRTAFKAGSQRMESAAGKPVESFAGGL